MVSTKLIGKAICFATKGNRTGTRRKQKLSRNMCSEKLIQTAAATEWGKKYDYASIRTYEDFKNAFPYRLTKKSNLM